MSRSASSRLFVQQNGGGPERPTGNLRDTTLSLGQGGDLFRLNCASCHGFSGGGCATVRRQDGAHAQARKRQPALHRHADRPGEHAGLLTTTSSRSNEKRAIIDYIQTLKESKDPGGSGIGRIGPVSEGLVIWVAGIGAIVLIIMWIGAKSATHSTANVPGPDELREMSPGRGDARRRRVRRRPRRPPAAAISSQEPRLEKRAERGVSFMFGLAALAGVAFIVVFVAWPYAYHLPGEGSQQFRFYTPLLGGLLGLMLLGAGLRRGAVGQVAHARRKRLSRSGTTSLAGARKSS